MSYIVNNFRNILALLFLVVVAVLSIRVVWETKTADSNRSSVITTKASVNSDHSD